MMKSKIFNFIIIVVMMLSSSGCIKDNKDVETNQLKLDLYFKDFEGGFILFNEKENSHSVYNDKQVDKRLSPCSTFKIANSLIGLESGVIKNKDYTYKWDGTNYPIESWNKDHTLETAIRNSVVWYYQRLAQNVGEKNMQEYIKKIDYGNNDISGGITQFWLGSTLKVSAREQVDFLKKLYHNQLPFNTDNMEIVRNIIILESNKEYIFSGKTGSSVDGLGWFVGILQKDDDIYYFATNILGKNATGAKAEEITIDILKYLNIYK